MCIETSQHTYRNTEIIWICSTIFSGSLRILTSNFIINQMMEKLGQFLRMQLMQIFTEIFIISIPVTSTFPLPQSDFYPPPLPTKYDQFYSLRNWMNHIDRISFKSSSYESYYFSTWPLASSSFPSFWPQFHLQYKRYIYWFSLQWLAYIFPKWKTPSFINKHYVFS